MAALTAIGVVVYGGYLTLPSILGAGGSAGAAMTPALAGGGTAGAGIAMQQAAVGTVKAAIITSGAYVVGRGTLDQGSYAKSELASGNGGDNSPFLEKQTDHIFHKADGHVANTAENRKILSETAKSDKHLIGEDRFGNRWFCKTQPDGRQSWVKVRNGKIENGGINNKPLTPEQILGNKGIPK